MEENSKSKGQDENFFNIENFPELGPKNVPDFQPDQENERNVKLQATAIREVISNEHAITH